MIILATVSGRDTIEPVPSLTGDDFIILLKAEPGVDINLLIKEPEAFVEQLVELVNFRQQKD